jgi:tetratricopeptide (TPR) repeat protein
VDAYRKAIHFQPDCAVAYDNLGAALAKQGKLTEAEAACRKAIRLKPDLVNAYSNLHFVLRRQGRWAAAARLWAEAFAALPGLEDDLRSPWRYDAACDAALAGCAQGKDAGGLADAERARLRRQALTWLRADLAVWRQRLEKGGDKARPAVLQMMEHWQKDPDFAGVRGPESLARLPEAERPPWQKLWGEVAALQKRAARPR